MAGVSLRLGTQARFGGDAGAHPDTAPVPPKLRPIRPGPRLPPIKVLACRYMDRSPATLPTHAILVRMPLALHAKLEKRAAEERRSVNAHVIWALEKHLAEKETA